MTGPLLLYEVSCDGLETSTNLSCTPRCIEVVHAASEMGPGTLAEPRNLFFLLFISLALLTAQSVLTPCDISAPGGYL